MVVNVYPFDPVKGASSNMSYAVVSDASGNGLTTNSTLAEIRAGLLRVISLGEIGGGVFDPSKLTHLHWRKSKTSLQIINDDVALQRAISRGKAGKTSVDVDMAVQAVGVNAVPSAKAGGGGGGVEGKTNDRRTKYKVQITAEVEKQKITGTPKVCALAGVCVW